MKIWKALTNRISLNGGPPTSDPEANAKFNVGVDEIFFFSSLFNLEPSAIWAFFYDMKLWRLIRGVLSVCNMSPLPLYYCLCISPLLCAATWRYCFPYPRKNPTFILSDSIEAGSSTLRTPGIKMQNMTATGSKSTRIHILSKQWCKHYKILGHPRLSYTFLLHIFYSRQQEGFAWKYSLNLLLDLRDHDLYQLDCQWSVSHRIYRVIK